MSSESLDALVVQFEYSATTEKEVSVATGETVKFVSKNSDGWIVIEKKNGVRGYVPEDWVLTADGFSIMDVIGEDTGTNALNRTHSTVDEEKIKQREIKEKKERKAVLAARLAHKKNELDAKQRALNELNTFLLNHQSAAASARMSIIEEDFENFVFADGQELEGFNEDDEDEDDEDQATINPGHQRANVVAEILETEKSYGNDLKLIVEQFMEPLAQKTDLFTPKAIESIFSNVLEIWQFQKEFVKLLDNSVGLKASFKSEIGQAFVQHANSFKLYTVYCANHSRATHQIEELIQIPEAFSIIEACRLLAAAKLSETSTKQSGIGLDGFLLTPIQRICKYPLLLKELVKATPTDHADYAPLENALEMMKNVAQTINEDKRNTEHLMLIEDRISNWQGPHLVETSSVLIHEGVLTKISGGKSQERQFYLFDNLLVYCKRTVSGRLVFRGRVPTDSLLIKDAEDGKFDGKSFTNGMVLENQAKVRTYVLYAKTAEQKKEWLDQFGYEREKVAADNSAGIDRRCRERLNTAAGVRRPTGRNMKKNKSMKEMRKTLHKGSVDEALREIEGSRRGSQQGRVAQFKPVDVRFSISKDSLQWASKPAQLFARTTNTIIQEILDRFMLSHLNPADFDLVQHTKYGGFRLPAEPIPLFSMTKSVEKPFHFYLHHRVHSQDLKLRDIVEFETVLKENP